VSIYELYRVEATSLDEARSLIERLLGLSFEEHDSAYHGGRYYRSGDEAHEHFVLKENRDPFEDEPAEDSFPDARILLYVNDTTRSSELERTFNEGSKTIVLLRHENL
jgi:hypothetical protein